MEDERWLMMAVLDHLQKASQRGDVNPDPVQEAMFAIANAYSLNMHNSATKERYPLNGLSLPEVYKAGREQLLAKSANGEMPSMSRSAPMTAGDAGSTADDAAFHKLVSRLKETTDFFKNVEEGTPEYERRLRRARERLEEKQAEKRKKVEGAPSAGASASGESPADQAEKLKIEGNNELKAKNYQKAHDLYTKCIELDGNNAVFYSNRAAANLHLSRYTEAVEDCKKAISLDGTFVRPRERLAQSYRYLGMLENEIEALKGAIEVAPHNDSFKAQLQEAESRLANGGGAAENAPRGGMPGMGGGAGGGLESLLGSTDPAMLSNMASSMGLNIPPGAVESFLSSGAADQIGTMLRNNPGIMQQAMQAMMGGGMPGMGATNQGDSNNANGNNQGS